MKAAAVHEMINPSMRITILFRAIAIDNAACQVKTSCNKCRYANGAGQASDIVFPRVVGLKREDGAP